MDNIDTLKFYEKSILSKSSRIRFNTAVNRSKGTLEYVYSDLQGPAQTISLSRARYFVSILDDYLRIIWVYVLNHKDEAFDQFKTWKTLMETQKERKIKRLGTNNGLEYYNKSFDDYCAGHGISIHKKVRNTPQHNELAERMNKTLIDKVKCMLIYSKLPMSLQAEALSTAYYIVHRSPSSGINFKIPVELQSEKLNDYLEMKIFGCPEYAHIKQKKIGTKGFKMCFLGIP